MATAVARRLSVGLAAAPPPQAMNTSRRADKTDDETNRFMMSSNNPERYRLIHRDATPQGLSRGSSACSEQPFRGS